MSQPLRALHMSSKELQLPTVLCSEHPQSLRGQQMHDFIITPSQIEVASAKPYVRFWGGVG